MNVTVEQVAKAMYDQYCISVGGKAYNGDDLPRSNEFFADETKKRQSEAWIEAAITAIEMINQTHRESRITVKSDAQSETNQVILGQNIGYLTALFAQISKLDSPLAQQLQSKLNELIGKLH